MNFGFRSSKRLKLEAGYNSHGQSGFGGDGIFGEGGSFIISPSSYYYNSPTKARSNAKGDVGLQNSELYTEDSLARKLNLLTGALTQGKPIRVDDLMSLRLDNEVNNYLKY